jgi:hypothetical protein
MEAIAPVTGSLLGPGPGPAKICLKSAEGNSEFLIFAACPLQDGFAGRIRLTLGLPYVITAKRPVPKVAENRRR